MYHTSIKKVPATLLALLLTILLAGATTAKQAEEEEESCGVEFSRSALCLRAGWELVEPDEIHKDGLCGGGPNEELGPPIEHHTCLCDEDGPDGQGKCPTDPVEINVRANLKVEKTIEESRTIGVFFISTVVVKNAVIRSINGTGMVTVNRILEGGVRQFVAGRNIRTVTVNISETGLSTGTFMESIRFPEPLAPGKYEVFVQGTVQPEVKTRGPGGATEYRRAIHHFDVRTYFRVQR